jgi:hypothetical protein
MLAGEGGQAYHGVLVDADQASRLANAATLVQMLEYRQRFVLGKFGVVEGRAFAFGEALLAGSAGQDTALFVGSIAKAHPQVVAAALTVVGAVGVEAAEVFQVVHSAPSRSQAGRKCGRAAGISVESCCTPDKPGRTRPCFHTGR